MRTPGSITEHDAAIAHFTDRHEATRLFCGTLHADPPHERILFFHGDGGNGKSLLLRYLREKHCRLLQPGDWERIRQLPDDAFERQMARVTPRVARIPVAHLDFGMQPQGHERPQEVVYALLMLRRQLAAFGLHFPLFDYAILWRLHRLGELSKENLHSLLPAAEMNFVTDLAAAIANHPVAGAVKAAIDFADARLQRKFTFLKFARHLSATAMEEIQRADPHSSLLDLLPRLFAQDLNRAMRLGGNADPQASQRVALFFDTHEAFRGRERDYRHAAADRDEWLRCLLLELDPATGIVAVVAGRDDPHWEQAALFPLPRQGKNSLQRWLVDHLSAGHARQYLQKVKADVAAQAHRSGQRSTQVMLAALDEALCESLMHYASARPNEVHPLHLSLSVDVVRAAAERGQRLTAQDFADAPEFEQRNRELINRLLRYVDDDLANAVRAVSACRAFDRELFKLLGDDPDIDYVNKKATFERLIGFSFVRQVEQDGVTRYRIHDTLRRLFREGQEELAHRADEVLEGYYRTRAETGDATARAEAIYHANRLDAERGAKEWVDTFNAALENAQYDLCNALLAMREELSIPGDFRRGDMAQSAGAYFADLARYAAAEQEYGISLAAYDAVLRQNPDSSKVHNNKGNTLARLGILQAQLGQHTAAAESYQQSVQAYDAALRLAPDDVNAHNNKGITLRCLGALQAALGQHTSAAESYQQSIQACDAVLHQDPDSRKAHNNKGLTLRRLGELQAQLGQHADAADSHQQSIQAYNAALRLAPDYGYAHNNKGITLQSLGDLQAQLGQHSAAAESYQQSIQAYDAALRLAPDDVEVLNNKGEALQRLGTLQAQLGQHVAAAERYRQSIQAYDAALLLAPDYVEIRNNRGNTLRSLGTLQAQLGQLETATGSLQQALAEFAHALRIAPGRQDIQADRDKAQAVLDALKQSPGQAE